MWLPYVIIVLLLLSASLYAHRLDLVRASVMLNSQAQAETQHDLIDGKKKVGKKKVDANATSLAADVLWQNESFRANGSSEGINGNSEGCEGANVSSHGYADTQEQADTKIFASSMPKQLPSSGSLIERTVALPRPKHPKGSSSARPTSPRSLSPEPQVRTAKSEFRPKLHPMNESLLGQAGHSDERAISDGEDGLESPVRGTERLYGPIAEEWSQATRTLGELNDVFDIIRAWQNSITRSRFDPSKDLEGLRQPFRNLLQNVKKGHVQNLLPNVKPWETLKGAARIALGPVLRELHKQMEERGYKQRRFQASLLELSNHTQHGLLQPSRPTLGRYVRVFASVVFKVAVAFFLGGEVEAGIIFSLMIDRVRGEWFDAHPDLCFGALVTAGVSGSAGPLSMGSASLMVQIGANLANDFTGWGKTVEGTTGTMPLNGGLGLEFSDDWTFEGIFAEGGNQWQVLPLNQFIQVGETFTCCGKNLDSIKDCFECMKALEFPHGNPGPGDFDSHRACRNMREACAPSSYNESVRFMLR